MVRRRGGLLQCAILILFTVVYYALDGISQCIEHGFSQEFFLVMYRGLQVVVVVYAAPEGFAF